MATGTASVHLVPATMNLAGTNIGALLGWPVPTKLQVSALFKGARDTYIRVLSSTTGDSIRHKTEKSGNFLFEKRKEEGEILRRSKAVVLSFFSLSLLASVFRTPLPFFFLLKVGTSASGLQRAVGRKFRVYPRISCWSFISRLSGAASYRKFSEVKSY